MNAEMIQIIYREADPDTGMLRSVPLANVTPLDGKLAVTIEPKKTGLNGRRLDFALYQACREIIHKMENPE